MVVGGWFGIWAGWRHGSARHGFGTVSARMKNYVTLRYKLCFFVPARHGFGTVLARVANSGGGVGAGWTVPNLERHVWT